MPFSQASHRLATVMFTDIVGYSRMMNEDQSATLEFLKRHNKILDSALKRHRGRLVKTIGDAYMAEFASPQAAMDCATAIQRQLEEAEGGRRFVRIGLHAGEIVDKKGDIFGETVNIAARLEPLAPHGGICISQATFEQLKPPRGCIIESAGPQALKNISQKVTLWRVFPTPASHSKVLDDRSRLRRRRIGRGLLGATLLSGLAVFGWRSRPAFDEFLEMRHWRKISETRFTSEKDRARWHRVLESDVNFDGGARLHHERPYSSLDSFPAQPFTVKIRFRSADPREKCVLTLMQSEQFLDTVKKRPDGSVMPWVQWDGVVAEAELYQRQVQLVTALVSNDLATHSMAGMDWLGLGTWHQLEARFDKDLYSVKVDGGKALISYVRKMGKGLPLKLGLGGENVVVESVALYGRKIDQTLDLASAANSLSFERRDAEAQMLYEVLARISSNDTDRSSYLLKSGDLYAQSGNTPAAAARHAALLAIPGSNIYKGYYQAALAEDAFILAFKASGLSHTAEAAQLARKSAQYSRRFLAENPGHPREPKGHFWLMRLDAELLGDAEGAGREARTLIQMHDPISSGKALDMLMKKILTPDQAVSDETLRYLQALAADGELPKWFLEDVKRCELSVLALRGDYGGYGRLLWRSELNDELGDSAERVFKELRALSWKPEFRIQMDAWAGPLEADPGKAAQFYRSVLRSSGIDVSRPIQDFRQDSPISGRAAEFFARNLQIRGASARPEAARAVFKPDPALNNFRSIADPFKSLAAGKGGILTGAFDSGHWYGVQLFLAPNPAPAKAGPVANLSGFEALKVRLRLTRGMHWTLMLSESGDGPSDAASFKGVDGADGEQYVFPGQMASGDWEDVTVHFSDLMPQLWWGNQRGNRTLDLQAIGGIVIGIGQKQGSGELSIDSIVAVP